MNEAVEPLGRIVIVRGGGRMCVGGCEDGLCRFGGRADRVGLDILGSDRVDSFPDRLGRFDRCLFGSGLRRRFSRFGRGLRREAGGGFAISFRRGGELVSHEAQFAPDIVAKAIAKRVDSSFELIVEGHGCAGVEQ
jgi:hypothetical protein